MRAARAAWELRYTVGGGAGTEGFVPGGEEGDPWQLSLELVPGTLAGEGGMDPRNVRARQRAQSWRVLAFTRPFWSRGRTDGNGGR